MIWKSPGDLNHSNSEERNSKDETVTNEEKILMDNRINIVSTAIKGLEQRNFTKENIFIVYIIFGTLTLQKPKIKQQIIDYIVFSSGFGNYQSPGRHGN